MNRLLTLDDLYSYYSSKSRSSHFSADSNDKCIVVQVAGKLNFDESKRFEGLKPVVLKACHTLKNRNKSYISHETMEAALPSFSNRPILGFIHEVDGELNFYDHRMHLGDEGELIYDEVPVGTIPESCNAHLEIEEDDPDGKEYVVVNGYIFEEYSKAAEIIEREQECSVSVELGIRDMAYSAKDKVLEIKDFYFAGVTILGKNPDGKDVEPGMMGSKVKLSDFSAQKNSVLTMEDLSLKIDKLSERIDALGNFAIQNQMEGGSDDMLEKLLEKYSTKIEDLPFASEIAEMDDETLELKFAEYFAEVGDTNAEADADPEADPEVGEPEGEGEFSGEGSEDQEDTDNTASTEFDSAENQETTVEETGEPEKSGCSFNLCGKKYEFELSLNEKIEALSMLVNDSYSGADNTWYCVQAYDDYVVMIDAWTGSAYRQSYTAEDGSYSLTGERVSVCCQWLTQEEVNALDEMRKDYNRLRDEVEQRDRDAVLGDKAYSAIYNTEAWKDLVKEAGKYSASDLALKADALFGQHCKAVAGIGSVGIHHKETKRGPYGNLFSEDCELK